MSSNTGGHDQVTFVQKLEGPGTQEPKWPATIDVQGITMDQALRQRDIPVTMPTAPWEKEQ